METEELNIIDSPEAEFDGDSVETRADITNTLEVSTATFDIEQQIEKLIAAGFKQEEIRDDQRHCLDFEKGEWLSTKPDGTEYSLTAEVRSSSDTETVAIHESILEDLKTHGYSQQEQVFEDRVTVAIFYLEGDQIQTEYFFKLPEEEAIIFPDDNPTLDWDFTEEPQPVFTQSPLASVQVETTKPPIVLNLTEVIALEVNPVGVNEVLDEEQPKPTFDHQESRIALLDSQPEVDYGIRIEQAAVIEGLEVMQVVSGNLEQVIRPLPELPEITDQKILQEALEPITIRAISELENRDSIQEIYDQSEIHLMSEPSVFEETTHQDFIEIDKLYPRNAEFISRLASARAERAASQEKDPETSSGLQNTHEIDTSGIKIAEIGDTRLEGGNLEQTARPPEVATERVNSDLISGGITLIEATPSDAVSIHEVHRLAESVTDPVRIEQVTTIEDVEVIRVVSGKLEQLAQPQSELLEITDQEILPTAEVDSELTTQESGIQLVTEALASVETTPKDTTISQELPGLAENGEPVMYPFLHDRAKVDTRGGDQIINDVKDEEQLKPTFDHQESRIALLDSQPEVDYGIRIEQVTEKQEEGEIVSTIDQAVERLEIPKPETEHVTIIEDVEIIKVISANLEQVKPGVATQEQMRVDEPELELKSLPEVRNDDTQIIATVTEPEEKNTSKIVSIGNTTEQFELTAQESGIQLVREATEHGESEVYPGLHDRAKVDIGKSSSKLDLPLTPSSPFGIARGDSELVEESRGGGKENVPSLRRENPLQNSRSAFVETSADRPVLRSSKSEGGSAKTRTEAEVQKPGQVEDKTIWTNRELLSGDTEARQEDKVEAIKKPTLKPSIKTNLKPSSIRRPVTYEGLRTATYPIFNNQTDEDQEVFEQELELALAA